MSILTQVTLIICITLLIMVSIANIKEVLENKDRNKYFGQGDKCGTPTDIVKNGVYVNGVISKSNDKKNTVKQDQVDKILEESEVFVNTLWGRCTVVAVQLPNGFTIVEHSGCVDASNYDESMGKEICIDRIKNEIWKLEGYKLQCKLGRLEDHDKVTRAKQGI